ncbi:MAG: tetratricopeptide repeat protein [Isosphaeraceae bacterium]
MPTIPVSRRIAFLALVTTIGSLARADEVVLISGSTVKGAVGGRVRGQIQAESASEISVKLGQNTISVPTDQITAVRYDGQPASMTLAETREAGGQLSEAADLYKKALGEAAAKPLIAQAARFKQADVVADIALADPSRSAEAVALLDGFVRAFPNARQTGAALEALARLQLQKGDYAAVEKIVADLGKLPRGGDRAAVLSARAAARRGDYDAALTRLETLIKSAPAGSPLKREAQLARAESLAGVKKFKEAESELRAVIQGLPAEDAVGQSVAYNTLGDCLRAAGRPKDALFAYLHTDVLYNKDKEQHPRALAQIAQLWRELKRDDRADEVIQRLKQEYPKSSWATGASKP